MMYSIGDILYRTSIVTDNTFFYIVSNKFTNYFGDIVYTLETLEDQSSRSYMKFNELQKFIDGWLRKADDLNLT